MAGNEQVQEKQQQGRPRASCVLKDCRSLEIATLPRGSQGDFTHRELSARLGREGSIWISCRIHRESPSPTPKTAIPMAAGRRGSTGR